jgi:hypothetical protein
LSAQWSGYAGDHVNHVEKGEIPVMSMFILRWFLCNSLFALWWCRGIGGCEIRRRRDFGRTLGLENVLALNLW